MWTWSPSIPLKDAVTNPDFPVFKRKNDLKMQIPSTGPHFQHHRNPFGSCPAVEKDGRLSGAVRTDFSTKIHRVSGQKMYGVDHMGTVVKKNSVVPSGKSEKKTPLYGDERTKPAVCNGVPGQDIVF